MHYVIAGGSGYVGGHLSLFLIKHGHQVTIISHSKLEQSLKFLLERFPGNSDCIDKIKLITYEEYTGFGDVLINLAGESIGAKKVTNRRLKRLLESRMEVLEFFAKCTTLPPIFMQASAVACYPNQDAPQTEASEANNKADAFGNLALQIEDKVRELNDKFNFKHYYLLRLGIVMSTDGGMMRKLRNVPPFKLLRGTNKVPFIAMEDLIRAIYFIVNQGVASGPVNMTAPEPASINELLERCFAFHFLPKIPVIPLFLHNGDQRTLLLKADQKITPSVLLDAGFEFYNQSIGTIVPPERRC